MELLLTASDSKSVSGQNHEVDSFKPGGLLNSNYQTIVKLAHNSSSENSLYRMKLRSKIDGFQLGSNVEVLLKVSIFTVVILSIFN